MDAHRQTSRAGARQPITSKWHRRAVEKPTQKSGKCGNVPSPGTQENSRLNTSGGNAAVKIIPVDDGTGKLPNAARGRDNESVPSSDDGA